MKNILHILFWVMVINLNLLVAQVQEGEIFWVFKQNITNGLSQNFVISIEEDKHGMLWVGTLDGINMFDGSQFRELGKLDQNKGNSNDYYRIFADQDGSIWTKRDDGIRHFNLATKTWEYSDILGQTDALCLLSDGRRIAYVKEIGFVWLEGPRHYVPLDVGCDKEITFRNAVIHVDEQSGDCYVMNSDGKLLSFNFKTNSCKIDSTAQMIGSNFIDMELVGDEIWMITNANLLLRFDRELNLIANESKFIKSLDIDRLSDMFYNERTQELWIAVNRKGVLHYDVKTEKWTQHQVKLLEEPQGEDEYVIRIYQNKKGKLYFGSSSNGLLIHDPDQINFYRIPEVSLIDEQLYNLRLPRELVQDDEGHIWIGSTGQGIWHHIPEENKTNHYTAGKNPNFIRSDGATQLLMDGDKLWVGYNGAGLDCIDWKQKKRLKSYPFYLPEFSENTLVNDILKDKNDVIWVATEYKGIFGIKPDGELIHLHTANSGIKYNRLYNLRDFGDKIIMCNYLGIIYELDIETYEVKVIETNLPAFSYGIKSINKDSKGNIWIGTGNQGIFLLDENWNSIDTFSMKTDQLLSDELCNIIEDKNGDIWASSNNGLIFIQENEGQYQIQKIYTQRDGLISNEFVTGAYLIDNEHIWFGTIEGINYFDPNKIGESSENLDIYIREIISDNKLLYEDIFHEPKTIEFGAEFRDLSVSFGTIGFVDGNRIQYKTKLVGYDKEWSEPSARKYVNYTNLSNGQYQLRILSTNYDGIWSMTPFVLNFEIQSSIFERAWVYVLGAFAILGIVFLIGRQYARFRVEEENKRSRIERELALMEMQALRAQINPHFLFNTMSSINNFILKNEKNIASFYLVKFAKLIRKILQFTTQKSIRLRDELEVLELYIEIEQMRLGESFDYFINLNLDEENEDIIVPPLILQPFVENAIWHGLTHKLGDKILTIDISKEKGLLLIKIIDNGIGRKKSKAMYKKEKTRSYGLEITQKRIQLWDELADIHKSGSIEFIDLEDEYGISQGTEVHFRLPVVRRKLENNPSPTEEFNKIST